MRGLASRIPLRSPCRHSQLLMLDPHRQHWPLRGPAARRAGRVVAEAAGQAGQVPGVAARQATLPVSHRRLPAGQLEILPPRPRLRVIGCAVPGGSGFLPSTVSVMPPGLPSLMFTACRKVHVFDVPATT